MTKQEFIERLESGLAGVAPDERVAAVQYYTEYFDDAGPERENEVLEELGDPDKLSADIKAVSELVEEAPAEEAPAVLEAEPAQPQADPFNMAEVPEAPAPPDPYAGEAQAQPNAQVPPQYQFPGGYVPPRYGMQAQGQPYYNNQPPQPNMYSQRPASSGGRTAGLVILIILLLLFSPAIFGFAIAGIVICCIPLLMAAGFVFAAVVGVIVGLMVMPGSVASGIVMIGFSLVILAVALLCGWVGIKVFTKAIPAICRGIANIFRSLFGTKGRA